MAEPVILVEEVSKAYKLGASGANFSELLGAALRNPTSALRRSRTAQPNEPFWALRDISFEVHAGEAVGLIGPNGAGKSTLLKLLSRISPPTLGRMTLEGRVGTLLEVGTGFHPELSGRENVYLSGTILGMRRTEIAQRFDEIIEFAGIEQFLDTPVKRYSSGMYVRLAFAVAAHLEPEILFVDEVLAVGDAEFQKRCLGKMRSVVDEGRTIVFVSHNLASIRRLCPRALLIQNGRLEADGPSAETISKYVQRIEPEQLGGSAVVVDLPREGNARAQLRRVAMEDRGGQSIDRVFLGQPFTVRMEFEAVAPIPDAVIEVGISTTSGERVVTCQTVDRAGPELLLKAGTTIVEAEIDVTLLPGDYVIDVTIAHINGETIDDVGRVLSFPSLNVSEDGSDAFPWNIVRGFVRAPSRWSVDYRERALG